MTAAIIAPKEEEHEWESERDPLLLLANLFFEQDLADANMLEQIEADVRDEAQAAVEFALDAPYPDLSEVDMHVYV